MHTGSYDTLKAIADSKAEKYDCTVRALAVMLLDREEGDHAAAYRMAHTAMRLYAGRKTGCRVYTEKWRDVYGKLGMTLIPALHMHIASNARTVRSASKTLPRGRKFLILTRGHVCAFDGNSIVDWAADRLCRIVMIWEVINTPPETV